MCIGNLVRGFGDGIALIFILLGAGASGSLMDRMASIDLGWRQGGRGGCMAWIRLSLL